MYNIFFYKIFQGCSQSKNTTFVNELKMMFENEFSEVRLDTNRGSYFFIVLVKFSLTGI